MEKRRRSVSLSFVLLRFVLITGGMVVALFFVWYGAMLAFHAQGWVLPAYTTERQVRQFIEQQEGRQSFPTNLVPAMAHYVLFDEDGHVLGTVNKNDYDRMVAHYRSGDEDEQIYARYTYPDGTTVLFTWRYVSEFSDPGLRRALPPFEYMWYGVLAFFVVLCLGLTTAALRQSLVAKLRLFKDVSRKVARQELDFETPDTKIKEFNDAMAAMDEMRVALKESLAAQWAADQQRQMEISALAHDLKTPLTIIGGNAELLLEEGVAAEQKQMVKSIESSANRAKLYVSSMLDAAAGEQEAFEPIALSTLLNEATKRAIITAEKTGVRLAIVNDLMGSFPAQRERFSRALDNIIQNAIEHTPAGKTVDIVGRHTDEKGWFIQVKDNGGGFSNEALKRATERFWREDQARADGGHNGLGLWIANEVAQSHGGALQISNTERGGMVKIFFDSIPSRSA